MKAVTVISLLVLLATFHQSMSASSTQPAASSTSESTANPDDVSSTPSPATQTPAPSEPANVCGVGTVTSTVTLTVVTSVMAYHLSKK